MAQWQLRPVCTVHRHEQLACWHCQMAWLSATLLNGSPPAAADLIPMLRVLALQLNATLPASWADASPHIILLDLSNTSARSVAAEDRPGSRGPSCCHLNELPSLVLRRGAVPHSWWTSIGLLGTKDDGHAAASLVVLAGNQLTGTGASNPMQLCRLVGRRSRLLPRSAPTVGCGIGTPCMRAPAGPAARSLQTLPSHY